MGGDTNHTTGNRVSNCINLTYEDFSKLIVIPKDAISSFMDDFIDHITCGCISLSSFENYLGRHREYYKEKRDKKVIPEMKNFLDGTTLIDYIAKRNTEVHGNSAGVHTRSMKAKKTREGKVTLKSKPHSITNPYKVENNMLYGDFSGKILIRNVNVPLEERLASKDTLKADKKKKLQATLDANFNPSMAVRSGELSSDESQSESSPNRHVASNKSLAI